MTQSRWCAPQIFCLGAGVHSMRDLGVRVVDDEVLVVRTVGFWLQVLEIIECVVYVFGVADDGVQVVHSVVFIVQVSECIPCVVELVWVTDDGEQVTRSVVFIVHHVFDAFQYLEAKNCGAYHLDSIIGHPTET